MRIPIGDVSTVRTGRMKMVTLSRRCREKIVIDDHMHVEVQAVSDGRVTLRVSTPADVRVQPLEQNDGDSLDCESVLVSDVEVEVA